MNIQDTVFLSTANVIQSRLDGANIHTRVTNGTLELSGYVMSPPLIFTAKSYHLYLHFKQSHRILTF